MFKTTKKKKRKKKKTKTDQGDIEDNIKLEIKIQNQRC